MARSKESKIRYAVIGLGDIVQEAVLPGFHHCDHSRVAAFVSGDPEKHRALGARYGVSRHYHYNQLEECLAGNDVDAVYIGLPNHLHREYAVRCAAGKKHVLCEKPMAINASECRDMIDAARANKVKLMIAYRLHFEEGNLEAIRLAQSGEIGEPRYFSSAFSQQVRDGNVRLAYGSEEGGGPVFDMGVYCINAARYLFQQEPVEISAMTANDGEPRFARTEEMATVAMRFPDERLASFTVSFGAADMSSYSIVGRRGAVTAQPAYDYTTDIRLQISIGEQKSQRTFPKRDQFAAEIDYFSDCIRNNREPEPDGQEGLIDVMIVEAIYESARAGKPVLVNLPRKLRRPDLSQSVYKPPVRHKPETVHVSSPSA